MNHRLKTRIFKILSIFPDGLGYSLYHLLQDIGSKQTFEDKIKSTKLSYTTICRILEKNNLSLENMKIAELGSGWLPILPYQLILEGKARKVDTYDINEHYNTKEIKEVNDYYSNSETFEIESRAKYPLHKTLTYFPKTSICDGNLDDVDLVVSRFVLEHVPVESIIEMHEFFNCALMSGSYILHLISPSDHRSYTDSSLSLQDFLKYSQEDWDDIQTKFDYHNRLRLPQYLEIFKGDFEIISLEHSAINTNTEEYKKFSELAIHEDFSKFNEQELMAGSINILLKKK
ncbi:hypothetical protein FQU23_008045 [Flavobacterium sp. XN-5]|uniref:hypothetical protein n=1 Tax=Flavobacterium sp. XN-5 TaxID=2599390 RepID=UPI0011CC93E7|nr:hypothetical protein [Flavobacterium sp. XN-5]NGY37466.1 hypothetical protein [Flavobacterium sp. XN-5]